MNKFKEVTFQDNILTLTWLENTENLTDELFKNEALEFKEAVRKHTPESIIVDMRDFNYILSEDLLNWRNKNIIPVYNEIGLQKFAFIVNNIKNSPKPNSKNNDDTFETEYFDNVKEAVIWLNN